MLNIYRLGVTSDMQRYFNYQSEKTFDRFQNVTNLTVFYHISREKCQFYFSHVTSLILENTSYSPTSRLDTKVLKMFVNLSNHKHAIDSYYHSMDHSCNLKQFCEIFSDLEELRCNLLNRCENFLFLLTSLPKLSFVTVESSKFTYSLELDWLEEYQLCGRIIRDYHQDQSKHFIIIFPEIEFLDLLSIDLKRIYWKYHIRRVFSTEGLSCGVNH